MKGCAFLEKFKTNLIAIYHNKLSKPVDTEALNINCKRDLDSSLESLLHNLSLSSQLLNDAYENSDELAVKSALLRIRAHAISLSGFFDAIRDDTEALVLLKNWQKFPENYELPASYNYPVD